MRCIGGSYTGIHIPGGFFSAVVLLPILSLPGIPVSHNSNVISEYQNPFSLITAACDMFLLVRGFFWGGWFWLVGWDLCLGFFAFLFIMCFIASADQYTHNVSSYRSWKIPEMTAPAYHVLP